MPYLPYLIETHFDHNSCTYYYKLLTKFPAGIAHLASGLTDMDGNNFSHTHFATILGFLVTLKIFLQTLLFRDAEYRLGKSENIAMNNLVPMFFSGISFFRFSNRDSAMVTCMLPWQEMTWSICQLDFKLDQIVFATDQTAFKIFWTGFGWQVKKE